MPMANAERIFFCVADGRFADRTDCVDCTVERTPFAVLQLSLSKQTV